MKDNNRSPIRDRKATAISPANIAFIKFWGKKEPKLNIPFNDSISMNLSGCLTTTTVEFDKKLKNDEIFIRAFNKTPDFESGDELNAHMSSSFRGNHRLKSVEDVIGGVKVEGPGRERVVAVLAEVRKKAKIKIFAKVTSKNNFPSDAGIASSASGFSALALAASRAAGLKLSVKELSILARLGSGSACRSIPEGFVYWKGGKDSQSSYAYSIASPDFWDIRDLVAVTSSEKKKAGSGEGHSLARTSPYFGLRQRKLSGKIARIKRAILKKDFETFGKILEEEAIDLHVMAMTSSPPIFYWNGGTVEVMNEVWNLREKGIACYFTIDAGPNVHVICRGKDAAKIKKSLTKVKSVLFVIPNRPAAGARIIK